MQNKVTGQQKHSVYEKRFLRNPRMLDIANEIFFQGLIGSMGDTFEVAYLKETIFTIRINVS